MQLSGQNIIITKLCKYSNLYCKFKLYLFSSLLKDAKVYCSFLTIIMKSSQHSKSSIFWPRTTHEPYDHHVTINQFRGTQILHYIKSEIKVEYTDVVKYI